MSERTRLDEIVEEQWFSATGSHLGCRAAAKEVAERAFDLAKRKALEIALLAAGDPHDNPEGCYRAGEIARHIRERVVPEVVVPVVVPAPSFFVRRGSERRRGTDFKNPGPPPLFCNVHPPPVLPREDRRKKHRRDPFVLR